MSFNNYLKTHNDSPLTAAKKYDIWSAAQHQPTAAERTLKIGLTTEEYIFYSTESEGCDTDSTEEIAPPREPLFIGDHTPEYIDCDDIRYCTYEEQEKAFQTYEFPDVFDGETEEEWTNRVFKELVEELDRGEPIYVSSESSEDVMQVDDEFHIY